MNPNTIASALEHAVAVLEEAGVPSPRVDAELLVGHVLGLSRGGVQAKVATDAALSAEDSVTIAGLVERRAARERIALLREEVLPAHENLVREHQREYDYMLAGAFELIEARRDQYRAYRDYLAAVAEHLLAGIDLSRAVGTDLGAAVGDALPDPDLPGAAPASDAVDHSSHTHGDTP